MKKLLMLLFVVAAGCATTEKYVPVAREATPKAVMIEVITVMEVSRLVLDENGLRIETSTQTVKLGGSGVFISGEGHFLTCDHVIAGEVKDVFITTSSGDTYKAEMLYQEKRLDLALGKINEHNTSYAKIADPRELKVGQEVLAIGKPLGFDFSVSKGIISALNRDVGVYNMTQSDASINPGNSGGPLFNMKGELIGINSRIVPPVNAPIFTGLGFSVQCGQIREFLTRFKGLEKATGGI